MFWIIAQADAASQGGAFHDVLNLLQNVFGNPMAISLVFSLSVAVVAILASYRFKLRKTEIEASLKQEMIERGMSADEIQRVLAAKTNAAPKKADAISKETGPYPNQE